VIAQSLAIGRTAVGEYIRRAAVVGITWPVPDELDDAALERKLFAPAGYQHSRTPLPDWAHVHAELRRRSVTLALLWQDYRGQHPDGYGYSRFCDLYGEWRRGLRRGGPSARHPGRQPADEQARGQNRCACGGGRA
jgi:transposase